MTGLRKSKGQKKGKVGLGVAGCSASLAPHRMRFLRFLLLHKGLKTGGAAAGGACTGARAAAGRGAGGDGARGGARARRGRLGGRHTAREQAAKSAGFCRARRRAEAAAAAALRHNKAVETRGRHAGRWRRWRGGAWRREARLTSA